MDGVLTFWLEKGVDGFRIDAMPFLFEIPIEEMVDADETLRNPYAAQDLPQVYVTLNGCLELLCLLVPRALLLLEETKNLVCSPFCSLTTTTGYIPTRGT